MGPLEVIFLPLQYNSACIPFPEWISLFTLCLAPLIAHVVAGPPQPSYLTRSRPKWQHRVCHYNPTSILWRYAAITDRRIRAMCWNHADMAASNAIFWTSRGWDGSERMVAASAQYCTQLPEQSRASILSVTMFKTVIVTLQGVSTLYILSGSINGPVSLFPAYIGVDGIFFPLALLGLLRLCAAPWLTEDFGYTLQTDIRMKPLPHAPRPVGGSEVHLIDQGVILDYSISPTISRSRFRPTSYGPSRVFRMFYILLVLLFWTLCAILGVPGIRGSQVYYTATSFLFKVLYFLLTTVSITVYAYYFIRGSTVTTILPCIASTWYQIYTLVIMIVTGTLIIIASVETNEAPGGGYTSYPSISKCSSGNNYFFAGVEDRTFFGLISGQETISGYGKEHEQEAVVYGNSSSTDELWIYYNFTGYCYGQFD